MENTIILFTDATTAEAIVVLKALGYIETPDGGRFLKKKSPIKIYSVWGKAAYYPSLLKKVSFTPRIQLHFKCAESSEGLTETMMSCAKELLHLAEDTRIVAFDAGTGKKISLAAFRG